MNIVYIDVENSRMATKNLGRSIDWSKLYEYLKEKFDIDKIYYAVGRVSYIQEKYDRMETIGYTMLYKKALLLPNKKVKGNVDIDIAIRSIFDLTDGNIDKAYLITNDGDYNTLIEVFQEYGVWGRLITPDIHTASRLLRNITRPIDMQEIKNKIQKIPHKQDLL